MHIADRDHTDNTDMENIPNKPSAARVIFLAGVKFWSEHTGIFCRKWQHIIQYALSSSEG